MANLNTTTTNRDIQQTIKIVSSTGANNDITDAVNILNIHEDIFNPVVSGSMQIADGSGSSISLDLHGNEYVYISFQRPDQGQLKYERTFRIYKISDRKPNLKNQSQFFTVWFCSEELVFSNQLNISKTLKDVSATQHVYNILTQTLRANKKRVNAAENFETSSGIFRHVLTNYKPFEAINYLAAYSFNANESPFLFFENRYGYNFISLETLLKRPVLNTLNYGSVKYAKEVNDSTATTSNEVIDFNFEQVFNILDNTRKATYAGKLKTLDLIRQKYRTIDYTVVNSFAKNILIDGSFPLNDAQNRNEKPLYAETDSEINYWLTNLGQTNYSYFAERSVKVQDSNIETVLLQRKTQLNLLKNTLVECTVSGNPLYAAGFLVNFNLPAFTKNLSNERVLDSFYKGKYLITAVRHNLTKSGGLQTQLTLCKNSVATGFPRADNTSSVYKTVRDF